MRRLLTLVLVLLPAAPAAALPADARISTGGLGAVRIGMTAAQVERVTGRDVRLVRTDTCTQAFLARRVLAMFTGRRLVRIDVRTRRHATLSGVRVGDSERRVMDTYGSRIEREPHKYVKGWSYLRFTDGRRRVVFESDGRRVRMISTGRLPEIDYVENCG